MSCSSIDGVIFQQRSDHSFKGYIGLKTFCILNEEKDLIYVQCNLTVHILLLFKCCTIVDYTFSQSINLLGLICNITFTFSTTDCSYLLILHFSIVIP
jgi:hypothetical protein